MDALLLALLLGLALDQGDRSQRLATRLGASASGAMSGMISVVCLIVIVGAIVAAGFGLALAPYLRGPAGLLFFALALALGAVGLLIPVNGKAIDAAPAQRGVLLGQLLLNRIADRSAFLIVGVVGLTGNAWASALGGAMGGLAALLPPLLAGDAYERALPLRMIKPVLGGLLLLAGIGCGLRALGLL